MLTGGDTASSFYKVLAKRPEFRRISNVRFYVSDERAVPLTDPESNYSLIKGTLFPERFPMSCTLHPMRADLPDLDSASNSYELLLPTKLDLVLLSVAQDGHVASIFPGNIDIFETNKAVMQTWSPNPPHQRLTITPKALRAAQSVYIMALGKNKKDVYKHIIENQNDPHSFPAHVVPDAIWLFDRDYLD